MTVTFRLSHDGRYIYGFPDETQSMRYESHPTLCAEQGTNTTTDKDVMERCMSAEDYVLYKLAECVYYCPAHKPVDEDIQ